MNDWDGKNLDWPKPGPFGQLNLSVAQKWDAIVSAAEQSGVFFQMTLQHHGQYSSSVDPQWNANPYNTANGGFLTNPAQFFTNVTAKALTKRKLRYAVARWAIRRQLWPGNCSMKFSSPTPHKPGSGALSERGTMKWRSSFARRTFTNT